MNWQSRLEKTALALNLIGLGFGFCILGILILAKGAPADGSWRNVMKITEKNRATSIVVLIMAAFNGLFLFGNGLFMLVTPLAWYYFVPGVTNTGFFNQHFIRDIGLIQMFLGAAFCIGMVRPARRFELWAAATSWLIAHAVFHLWEVAVGICAPSPYSQSTRVRKFTLVPEWTPH